VSNTYQKKSRRAQPDPMPAEVAVPEQVIVSMAEIAESAKEGLLALAVGTGLQVLAAMFADCCQNCCHDRGQLPTKDDRPGTSPQRTGTPGQV